MHEGAEVNFQPAFYVNLTYPCASRIHLFAIDYEHGRICPETIILPVPRYLPFAVLRGQGRVLGFIPTQPSAVNSERAKIVVVHLDYPETTLEIPLPRTAAQIVRSP